MVPKALEPDVAFIDSVANRTDMDQPEWSREYERGLVVTRRSVDQGSLGISICNYIEGQAGGGESTGGSYLKVGSSTTISAEYMHALEQGKDTSQVVKTHIGAIPRAMMLTIIEQAIQRGEATVKIKERLVLDLAWWFVDWKKMRKGAWLNNNLDIEGWNGKSRVLWVVENSGELEAQLHGRHVEYPGARGHNLLKNARNRAAYEWLMNEDNRTIESETTIEFDTLHQSDATIRYETLD